MTPDASRDHGGLDQADDGDRADCFDDTIAAELPRLAREAGSQRLDCGKRQINYRNRK